MPHQCTYCSRVYPDAAEELLKGCDCGSRFFYYIKQEKYEELKKDARKIIVELEKADLKQVEKDIRELTGLTEEPDKPVILDLESIRVIKPGKFEIDIVNLFSKKRPIIYKLAEGKYIIDLASSLKKKGAFEFPETKNVIDNKDLEKDDEQNSEEIKEDEMIKEEEKIEENISEIENDSDESSNEED